MCFKASFFGRVGAFKIYEDISIKLWKFVNQI